MIIYNYFDYFNNLMILIYKCFINIFIWNQLLANVYYQVQNLFIFKIYSGSYKLQKNYLFYI